MSNDTRSTILGLVVACAIAGLTYIEAGIDIESPLWWAGLMSAWASVIKGYYHNKPHPVVMADEPTLPKEPPTA
jgi:hypothetical protein